MNTDLAAQLVTARTAQTQQSVQIAVFKKAHEMQSELLTSLLDTAVRAPAPAGQGAKIDKLA